MRFKERKCLHNLTLQVEATSVDVGTAACFQDLAKIINEDGYTNNRFFYVNETALYGKKMP